MKRIWVVFTRYKDGHIAICDSFTEAEKIVEYEKEKHSYSDSWIEEDEIETVEQYIERQ